MNTPAHTPHAVPKDSSYKLTEDAGGAGAGGGGVGRLGAVNVNVISFQNAVANANSRLHVLSQWIFGLAKADTPRPTPAIPAAVKRKGRLALRGADRAAAAAWVMRLLWRGA